MYVPRGAFATLSGQPLEILPKGNEAAAVTVLSTLNSISLQFTAPLRPAATTSCTPLGTLYLFYRRHFRGGESKPLSALRRGDQIALHLTVFQ